jgi:acetylornithine aminotransferase
VLVEPVQGEGGVKVPDAGYLAALRDICSERGWLLMLDEVQCGNCRTGTWYACQGESVRPDIITTAKALANGVPIGVCMASGDAAEVFSAGHHGSTYGGNPLACAAALAVVETMERDGLAEQAARRGEQIRHSLQRRIGDLPGVTDIRGRGLMIGVELSRDCAELVPAGLAMGLLINVTAGNTIRLLPPLIISEEQADVLSDGICTLVETFLGGELLAAAST